MPRQQSKQRNKKELTWRSAILTGLAIGLSVSLLLGIPWLLAQESTHEFILGVSELFPMILALVAGTVALFCFSILKMKLRGRLILFSVLLVAGALGAALLRLDGFYGSMYPRFVWRWTPSSNEMLNNYLKDLKNKGEERGGVAEKKVSIELSMFGDKGFPGFRGSERLGKLNGVHLATNWDVESPKQLWRHPIGLGWSGFAAVGDQAFTQEQRGELETVVCYDLFSGREIWVVSDRVDFHPSHGEGPRATPLVYQEKVYAVGATGILSCIRQATGERIWRKTLLPDPESQNQNWGVCGSPLIVNDLLIVCPGLANGGSLLALTPDNGEKVWSSGSDPAAYASPHFTNICGKPQVLYFNGAGLSAHDASSGHVLWSHPWVTHGANTMNAAQPIVPSEYNRTLPPNQILIASGYGKGCVMLEIRKVDGELVVIEKWENSSMQAKFSSMLVKDDCLFGLDNGILVCLDLKSGDRIWKRGRYGHGQMLLVGDLFLIQAESGNVILAQASSAGLNELGRFPALSSKTWNHMALTGNILLVRNDREAAAYELPVKRK